MTKISVGDFSSDLDTILKYKESGNIELFNIGIPKNTKLTNEERKLLKVSPEFINSVKNYIDRAIYLIDHPDEKIRGFKIAENGSHAHSNSLQTLKRNITLVRTKILKNCKQNIFK